MPPVTLFLDQLAPVAVVPIVANVGAALLPAIIAGAVMLFGLLLNPRELVRACRAKPHIPLIVLLVGVCGYGLYHWLSASAIEASPQASARKGATGIAPSSGTDWSKVALSILRQEELAARKAVAPTTVLAMASGPAVTPATLPAVAPLTSALVAMPPVSVGKDLIYRGDPGRSGHGGGSAPLGLQPLWEHTEDLAMYLSSPLVAGDAVYGAQCILDPPHSYGSIVCLDAATGALRWRADATAAIGAPGAKEFKGFFSSPAITADRKHLVIGQGLHSDADSDLVCLDATTGAVRWTIPTSLHIEGSPAIAGDLVVAGAGAIEDMETHQAKGDPGKVICARISTGEKLWEFTVIDPESSPAIVAGVVYVGSGFNGKALLALRMDSDAELKAKGLDRLIWRHEVPHPAVGCVTVAGELVIVGCGNGDYIFAAKHPEGFAIALDRATGRKVWEVKTPDAVLGAIAIRDGVAMCPVRNGELLAIDIAKGTILWRQEDPAARLSRKAALLAGPAFVGDHVYAVSQDGYLGVFSATSGQLIERHYLNAKGKPGEMGLSVSSPFVADGRVYVGSETGGLRCLIGTKR